MTQTQPKISDEVGALIEQHLHAVNQAEKNREKRQRWFQKVKATVDALRACTPGAIGPELLQNLRTNDATEAERALKGIVRNRWRPAAQAISTHFNLSTLRRIPFEPHPLLEAVSLLFAGLVEKPENERVEQAVVAELVVLLTRTGVDAGDLFRLFDSYTAEFELVRLSGDLLFLAPWIAGPDPRGRGSCLEHDPRILAIRGRLKGQKATRAIASLKKLCADQRSEIPRLGLPHLGLSPTTIDRAFGPRGGRRKSDDVQLLFRRDDLIEYVSKRWNPQTPSPNRRRRPPHERKVRSDLGEQLGLRTLKHPGRQPPADRLR